MAQLKPLVFIPCLSISPARIVSYTQIEGLSRRSKSKIDTLENLSPTVLTPEEQETEDKRVKSLENLKADKFSGALSKAAAKRIRMCINSFYVLSVEKTYGVRKKGKFKLNMFTVTLSEQQKHTDEFIKKEMLNRLLEDMRRKHGLKSYMWRAEIQEKRTKNIHFHITTNIYIDKYEFRHMWNRIQDMYGYLNSYYAEHGHKDVNSTDVLAVKEIHNLAAYMAKYLSKSTQNASRQITGRQWFLSSNLSKIKPIQLVEYPELMNEIIAFTQLRKKAFKQYPDHYAAVSYADIFSGELLEFPLLAEIKQDYFDRYVHLVN